MNFTISSKFVDDVGLDVVPLEIYIVVFGNPYIWDRDAIYYQRRNQYRLIKYGNSYIIHTFKTIKRIHLITSLMKTFININKKSVLLMVRDRKDGSIKHMTLIPYQTNCTTCTTLIKEDHMQNLV